MSVEVLGKEMPQLCGMQLCFDLSFVKLMSAAVQPIPFEYPFPKVGAVMSGENRVAIPVCNGKKAPQVCGSSRLDFDLCQRFLRD